MAAASEGLQDRNKYNTSIFTLSIKRPRKYPLNKHSNHLFKVFFFPISEVIFSLISEERQKPQPPLLLKKYRNTPPICIAVRLQFVLQHFWCPYTLKKGKTVSTPPICIAVRLPFVLQYASHSYRSTFGKISVVTGMFPIIRSFLKIASKILCSEKHLIRLTF